MLLFLLLMLTGLVSFEDLGEFWSDILNIKYGTLGRWVYFGCTWVSTFVITAVYFFFIINMILRNNVSTESFEYFLAYGSLYLIITLVQLSGFLRRMNDAQLSHWYALVFLIPGIGNIIAFLIALLPSDFGSPY